VITDRQNDSPILIRRSAENGLKPYVFYLGHGILKPMYGGSRVSPGQFGALFSRMGKALLNETHQKALKEGKFTGDDMRAIVMWLDMNSNQLNAYKNVEDQKAGKIVWPEFDVVRDNFTGVERR
jgi:hypothetical protein